ncbi:RICIN domain-containing protein [Streptomyces luteogriseus]|uniref:RICIN domain-containing protein n=1 Tax=Streptomyces luteogriseus TaxID=68233 RepID=UPI002E304A28|nr:RICIN domain-containing protein [Streptomyces luteogriseus]WTJ25619.1 RICIN domain-containing protein [Streptomyces luteogriseus]
MRAAALALAAATSMVAVQAGTASATSPGWEGTGRPDVVGDCNRTNSYQAGVSPGSDGCIFHAVSRQEEYGSWRRASDVVENCDGDSVMDKAVTRMHQVNSSFTYGTTHTLSVGLDVPLLQGLKLGLRYDISFNESTTYGTADTAMESTTLKVPAGNVGWVEFRPRQMRTLGWLEAHYGKRVGPSGDQHYYWYYPYQGSTDLQAVTPIVRDGMADGSWRPVYKPCTYTVQGRGSGLNMDVRGASKDNGATVQIYPATGGDNQRWSLHPNGNGTYAITSVNSGKCLDVADGKQSDGAAVVQWQCNGGTNQAWRLSNLPSGAKKITSVLNNKCLEVYGASTQATSRVSVWSCNGGDNQAWDLTMNNTH